MMDGKYGEDKWMRMEGEGRDEGVGEKGTVQIQYIHVHTCTYDS